MRRGSIIPDFVKLQIQGQNVGNMVASRSKTSKQNLTVVVTAAVSVETISVGPVSESVAMSISSVVVRLRLSLSLPLGNMDGSSGVGDVAPGTSVASSNSGEGGVGKADGGEGGGGGDLGVAGDNGGNSVDGVGDNRCVGVAHDGSNSVVGRVDTVVRLGLSLPLAVVKSMAVTVGPVAKSVVATIVAAQAVAIGPVVSIGIGLRLGSGESRKGKCQDLRETEKIRNGSVNNRNLSRKSGIKIKQFGTKVEKLGSKVDKLGTKVEKFEKR